MKILIAEDDPVMLDTVDSCLRMEGFSTLLARNGREAVALWRNKAPDFICLDIMMPEVDGYEVCREIRSSDKTTPILFLSAKNEEVDVVIGLELGADEFIRKPFGKHELLARIRSVLRRSAHATSNEAQEKNIEFNRGELVLFPAELRAERSATGESIELSPREISILQLLHERAGRAVHRDEILDRCWGMDYFPKSRTLDQHVANLRKRIELDSTAPSIIETVRGVGYRTPK